MTDAEAFLKRFCEEHARECEEQAARLEASHLQSPDYAKALRQIAESYRKLARALTD